MSMAAVHICLRSIRVLEEYVKQWDDTGKKHQTGGSRVGSLTGYTGFYQVMCTIWTSDASSIKPQHLLGPQWRDFYTLSTNEHLLKFPLTKWQNFGYYLQWSIFHRAGVNAPVSLEPPFSPAAVRHSLVSTLGTKTWVSGLPFVLLDKRVVVMATWEGRRQLLAREGGQRQVPWQTHSITSIVDWKQLESHVILTRESYSKRIGKPYSQ